MNIKAKYLAIKVSKGLKYIVFFTNLFFIVLLLLSIWADTLPPSQSLIIAYLGMGFPVLLIINILYLFLWIIFVQWKYITVSIVTLAACWNSISTYIAFNTHTEDLPYEDSIKFMSYNVRGFDWLTGDAARENPVFEYLTNSDAEIICFQEFAVEEKKNKDKIISLEEFDAIMKDYPYRSIIRLGDTEHSTMYGLACYSKYPILRVARLPYESENNGSAMYEIKVRKKIVTIVNNHLESNRLTAEDKELYKELVVKRNREKLGEVAESIQSHLGSAFSYREYQANIIAECIRQQREEAHAMIVCGDFNDPPISYAYRTIKGNMLDAFKMSGRGVGITYHEDGFWFRIDYIFYTKNIKAYNFTVDKVKYSDHYPIHCYLFLRYI